MNDKAKTDSCEPLQSAATLDAPPPEACPALPSLQSALLLRPHLAWDAAYAAAFKLRPHQVASVLAVLHAIESSAAGSKHLVEIATGGGKTAVASEVVAHHARGGRRVLVVSKDWTIIAQIAADLCRRHEPAIGWLSFVGPPSAREQFGGLCEGAGGQVVLTTIQTWYSRRKRDFVDEEFDLVIIDEVHWGESGDFYRALERRYGARCNFVGLTGTPRHWTDFKIVGPRTTMRDLLHKGLLAAPVVISLRTGIEWHGELTNAEGDFTARSLRELGRIPTRNELILSVCVSYAKRFGKTLIFACDIEHAERLAAKLRDAGITAEAYHSGLSTKERNERLAEFRSGRTQFLVNVTALTTGVDVADIRTVVLARPTHSDVLHTQMVGRGTRLADGKTEFYLVDLVDNVDHFGAVVVRPDGFFGSARLPSLRGPALHAHSFVRSVVRPFPPLEGYEALAGIPVSERQTFGIEFEVSALCGAEISMDRFQTIAEELRRALAGAVPTAARVWLSHSAPGQDDSLWNVEPDPSCGIEITTRILLGIAGFIEVVDGLVAIAPVLERYGLGVDVRTGTHVHLGWRFDADELRWLMNVIAYYEPALFSLVAPSRATNDYTTPLNLELDEIVGARGEREWQTFARQNRYRSINLEGLFNERGTVEIRTHSGTLEGPKILAWVGLFQTLFAEAWNPSRQPGDPMDPLESWPLTAGDRGDIVALAEFVGCAPDFVERLKKRRDFVVERSWKRAPEYADLVSRVYPTWRR